jgi:hypothetical protein
MNTAKKPTEALETLSICSSKPINAPIDRNIIMKKIINLIIPTIVGMNTFEFEDATSIEKRICSRAFPLGELTAGSSDILTPYNI